MNRRFVVLLVVLAISLQGPSFAYAAALSAKTMPAACAGQVLGHSGADDSSCCPHGILPGLCCAGGLVFTGMPSAPLALLSVSLRLMPAASGSVAFTTELPAPLLRPPIV
jgi:hypothetical protein